MKSTIGPLWAMASLVLVAIGQATPLRSTVVTNGGIHGFHGRISIPITNPIIAGWKIRVTFDQQPVSNVDFWQATILANTNNRVYVIENKSHNSHVSDVLDVDFSANTPGSEGTTALLELYVNVPEPSHLDAKPNAADIVPETKMPYAYDEVLRKSILFYEAQRSGDLPDNNRVKWRHDSTLNDGKDVGLDLTGGWFDAGDYVKFGLPMAASATLLAWGAIEFKDAYVAAGEMDQMRDCLKWATDYFIKCHSAPNELYVQVGNGQIDHAYWNRPEDIGYDRPSYKVDQGHPGSDVAGETAAALAASFIVFSDTDPAYAATLLKHAKELFHFAENYQGIYSDSIADADKLYRSSGFHDELAWAAAWLYLATEKDTAFLYKAKQYYKVYGADLSFYWDNKEAGVQMLMYNITGEDYYASHIQATLKNWFPGGGVTYTPNGLAYRNQWGPNRYSANMALLGLIAAKHKLDPENNRDFALSQINYMLGDGGRSFVVGFGNNPPTRPHHASSTCPESPAPCGWADYLADIANTHVLNGALVGGPDINDNFNDERTNYLSNEVTCDYNAGFQSAVAGVYEMFLKEQVP